MKIASVSGTVMNNCVIARARARARVRMGVGIAFTSCGPGQLGETGDQEHGDMAHVVAPVVAHALVRVFVLVVAHVDSYSPAVAQGGWRKLETRSVPSCRNS